VLDDHSRYAIGLKACGDERKQTVQAQLTALFRRYGLPQRIMADNGTPWGCGAPQGWTQLGMWLLRLGITLYHSRPRHPQTMGKDERFHRTLAAEVLSFRTFADLAEAQARFDEWRDMYNHERPHQSLDMAVPASRYQLSPRPFPESLPAIEYGPDDLVRKVQGHGFIYLHNRTYYISEAFRGFPVALRPTTQEGVWDVYFCHQRVTQIDERTPQ